MTHPNCPDETTLEKMLLGTLPEAELETLSEHLSFCDRCLNTAETLEVRDDLTDAVRIPHELAADDDVLTQAIARGKLLANQLNTTQIEQTQLETGSNDTDKSVFDSFATSQLSQFGFLSPPEQPDELGRLGEYRVLQLLGVGGMGIVFRAEDPRLKRQVALKVMKPSLASGEAAKNRFIREAQFNAAIEHDNIVHIYQVGEDRGVPFIAMQYLRGESLKTRIDREHKLAQPEVARIGKEIAAGLAAAHEQGLIHRDIKPDNIWIEEKTQRAKILDFGLVRAATEDTGLTLAGMVVGTPQYMAPEQALGQLVDHRCDLFSLGTVLYQLATGKYAFKGANLTATLMAVVHQDPLPIENVAPKIEPALAVLITKLLSKDRNDRPQTALEVSRELAEIEQKMQLPTTVEHVAPPPPIELSSSPTATASPPYRKPPRTRSFLAAAGGAAALLLLGVIIITITNKDGTQTKIRVPEGTETDVQAAAGSTVTITQDLDRPASNKVSTKLGWHDWPANAPTPAIAPFTASQAKQHQEAWAKYLNVPAEYANSIGMKFQLIPPGEFLMGSSQEQIDEALEEISVDDQHWQECITSEGPQHSVILTQPFYLGVNEVTQGNFEKVMEVNPSYHAASGMGNETVAGIQTSDYPVETVTWSDAAEFSTRLSKMEELKPFYFQAGETLTPLEGTGYRLPTEAEWEFACRAGTTTKFWIGDDKVELQLAGWHTENSGYRTHATGELKANPFGLYDMHGNVWEWVQDGWEPNKYRDISELPAINPGFPLIAGSHHIMRGGNWYNSESLCRSSVRNRNAGDPTYCEDNLGFRAALSVQGVRQSLKVTGPAIPDAVAAASPAFANEKPSLQNWPANAPAPAIAPFNADEAKQHQDAWAKYLDVPVEYTNSIGMKFRLLPPGEFLMGSTPEEIAAALPAAASDTLWQDCIRSEGPQHQVVLTQPVYLGVHEVTQSQYEQMVATNPSYFAASGTWAEYVTGIDTSSFPVEGVTWDDATDFCRQLIAKEELHSSGDANSETTAIYGDAAYRLPTEAEWEFACRAGAVTTFCIGKTDSDLYRVGWSIDTSSRRTHAVGELQPNSFGLYDMHGNAWEWALDAWSPKWYSTLKSTPVVNPINPPVLGSERMARGGNYISSVLTCRSGSRCSEESCYNSSLIGFRVVLSIDAVRYAMKQTR